MQPAKTTETHTNMGDFRKILDYFDFVSIHYLFGILKIQAEHRNGRKTV